MNAQADLYPVPDSVSKFISGKQPLLIGDRWLDAESGETLDIIDPSTGKVLTKAAMAGVKEIDMAVKAARAAFDTGPWPRMSTQQRRNLLLKLADAVEANIDDFAMIDALNMGAPLPDSRYFGCQLSIELLRYYAGWCDKLGGETYHVAVPDQHAYTLREPIGVVGAIVPWNTPLMDIVIKVAPALAAGCTIVVKPAEITPLSSVRLGQLIEKVGFPPGVVNIVTGLGSVAGQALTEHPGVDKIAFTGSSATGQHIIRTAAGTMKRVSLELGGKSPCFIFPDADLDLAIPMTAMLIFKNTGQVCAANSRLFVHEDVLDKVVNGITAIAKGMKVGGPLEKGVDMGPVVSERQLNRVTGYIDSGRAEGAELIMGGNRMKRPGFFVEPTVMVNTTPNMKVVREEIFGPVLSVMRMTDTDVDTMAAAGNASDYGLAAYIWTNNISKAHLLAQKLRSGSVRINGGVNLDPNLPYGGAKMSGWGREYGREGVHAYTELKTISVALTAGLGKSSQSIELR